MAHCGILHLWTCQYTECYGCLNLVSCLALKGNLSYSLKVKFSLLWPTQNICINLHDLPWVSNKPCAFLNIAKKLLRKPKRIHYSLNPWIAQTSSPHDDWLCPQHITEPSPSGLFAVLVHTQESLVPCSLRVNWILISVWPLLLVLDES